MSDAIKENLAARVTGRVQGVGFRHFTRREAQRLGLVGWVRNEDDGSVQLVAEGSREQLEQLLEALHRGPTSASVSEVEAGWTSANGTFERFSVKY